MRFHLSSEQRAIQDAVSGTLKDVWGMARLHDFADAESDFDPESWRALMALGAGAIALPEHLGGAGLGLLDAALVCELAGAAAAPGPLIGQILTGLAISLSENPAAHALLPSVANGDVVATLALDGDLAQSARAASLFLTRDAHGGVCLARAGKGVIVEAVASTDRSRPVSRVRFEGVETIELLAAGDGRAGRLRDAALVLIAADALGGAQHCTDIAVAYANERTQFGQAIGRFQALKHQLVQMALEVEPARALVWYAAHAWDAKLPDASRAASLAKAHLCDVYTRVTRAAIAAHGGIGYTWEYGLNYWFRRAIADRVWMGSPAQHRARAADLAGW